LPAEGQGPVRFGLPGHHPGPVAERFRQTGNQARSAAKNSQGERGARARTAGGTVKVTFDQLKTMSGTDLGVSDWIDVSQERINAFADVTGDHQWIHVDVERAKTGPFGTTIAHGYLTLALLIPMWTNL